MNVVHHAVSAVPSWVDLGPTQIVDGFEAREVLGDWSHLLPCDRPPRFLSNQPITVAPTGFDRSEEREDIPLRYAGKDIRDLQGIHSGAVAILFNGQSMAQHDLSKINCPIVGMNRTHLGWPGYKGPQPDYLCIIDHVWFDKPEWRAGILKHPRVINGSTHKADIGYRVARSIRMSPFSFDLGRDGFVPPVPCTTGHLALQLAVYLGFTELYCLGFDLGGKHFDGTGASLHFGTAIYHHKRQAEVLKERGINVWIVGSPDSKAPFPHKTFEESFA